MSVIHITITRLTRSYTIQTNKVVGPITSYFWGSGDVTVLWRARCTHTSPPRRLEWHSIPHQKLTMIRVLFRCRDGLAFCSPSRCFVRTFAHSGSIPASSMFLGYARAAQQLLVPACFEPNASFRGSCALGAKATLRCGRASAERQGSPGDHVAHVRRRRRRWRRRRWRRRTYQGGGADGPGTQEAPECRIGERDQGTPLLPSCCQPLHSWCCQ